MPYRLLRTQTLKTCFVLLAVAAALFYASTLFAATRTAPAKSSVSEADYTRALAAADHFLQAWQGGDIETGTVMLTTHAKNKTNHDDLEQLFSNSAPAAYEIERGKWLRRGRYEFPIVLLSVSPNKTQRRFSAIVVLNTGHNDWAVDKLP
jgi:methyl coenzyme M reductase subunit D